ncbi:MAG: 30S ribosome-binding factor RbfA [Deltaproteobacteria bacterium]|nr:MAG: 30S ribosome-binding factor RbfA [Deltaproteobacteria bacterium]
MSKLRAKRVSDLLKEETARIIQYNIKDPRVGFTTVTGAEVSSDLRYAKVFYTVFGDDAVREGTREGLESAKPYIRRELAKILSTKVVPHLTFVYDVSIERGQRLEDLINRTSSNEDD